MKNKKRKIILIGLVFVMLFALANPIMISGAGCGCADSYMGASYVESLCIYVGGELIFRRCVYEY